MPNQVEIPYLARVRDSHTEVIIASPEFCDFCMDRRGAKVIAKYDGATEFGPWANMCEICFVHHGIGLGLGRGQKLILRT